jgi:ATP-binding cassette subfamily B protein
VSGARRRSGRGLRQDASVLEQHIKPGTVRRILGIASPFLGLIWLFLAIVVADAMISVITPLLFPPLD